MALCPDKADIATPVLTLLATSQYPNAIFDNAVPGSNAGFGVTGSTTKKPRNTRAFLFNQSG
ncbi:hypothetical protein RM553_12635 [Zunongwangia sp. F363]|uniref:Uncharacterized protein n=1 Tax=Autumnicola tepida TaxID=3075595 RepID=A0ABU3CBH8_9FLAO|nr:hypothetical protein [Zunongwangia sp. F363]MDT0643681.1 hypothetical protein [Zunongwangia sp. F363]